MNRQILAHVTKLWKNSAKTLSRIDCPGELKKQSLKVDQGLLNRLKYLSANLQSDVDDTNKGMTPPDTVKGMTVLNRKAFTKSVRIPAIKIPKKDMNATQKAWKSLQLKIRSLKPVGELGDSDPLKSSHCLMFLDPDKLKADKLTEDQKALLQKFGLSVENPDTFEVELRYENWSTSDIMRAVLPSDADSVTSFTQIGHIAHLNLKPESLPYKTLIGEVILDKITSIKTVVNKLSTIDNTYRNFAMELLAGEDNYITQTKEHGCVFEMDFSKVYWNSRLSTEHQRIVEMVEKGSVVYDIFAGIGPFAVPLAKRKQCVVFANDLNPSSFEYLKKNIELNKITHGNVEAFNMDGREFIKTVVKDNLIKRIKEGNNSQLQSGEQLSESSSSEHNRSVNSTEAYTEPHSQSTVPKEGDGKTLQSAAKTVPPAYVIMNLPAIAVDFLDTFSNLLQDLPSDLKTSDLVQSYLPHVFCYAFSKTDTEQPLEARVEAALGQPLPKGCDIRVVRNVAPNKEMMCVSFRLWPTLVLGTDDGDSVKQKDASTENGENCKEPESKRQKLSS